MTTALRVGSIQTLITCDQVLVFEISWDGGVEEKQCCISGPGILDDVNKIDCTGSMETKLYIYRILVHSSSACLTWARGDAARDEYALLDQSWLQGSAYTT